MPSPTFLLPPVQFAYLAGPYGGVVNYTPGHGISLYVVDDNSCAWIADYGPTVGPQGQTHRFDIYVVDAGGAVTWYTSGTLSGYNYISSVTAFGPGNLLISTNNGLIFHARVANQRLNNTSPILMRPGVTPFSNQCYDVGSTQSVYYDPVTRLLAVAWYQASGELGTNIYSTIYSVDSIGNLTKQVDGYTTYACSGCVPPVPDAYDQTGGAATGGAHFYGVMTNGISAAIGGSNPNWFSRLAFDVHAGLTQSGCTAGNGNYVSIRTNDVTNIFGIGGTNSYLIDSNIIGIAGMANTEATAPNVGTLYVGGDNVNYILPIQAPAGSAYSDVGAGPCAITKKYIFLSSYILVGATAYLGGILIVPFTGISNGTLAAHRGVGLVNGARPISVTGKYKA
jgi:hypothetical protein